MITQENLNWLLNCDEPWTRYRARIDLLGQGEADPLVSADREEMLADERVLDLMKTAASWPGYALKRHNDAKHPLYAISTLADFGLHISDPGLPAIVDEILTRQDSEGAFLTRLRLFKQFGGLEGEYESWMLCDWPTLLYVLLVFGVDDRRLSASIDHLRSLGRENGWPCAASPMLGNFKGPGRREDPCPIANVYALKALSLVPDLMDSPETRQGTESLLAHWQDFALAREKTGTEEAFKPRKLFLFGVGSDFRKLKYPFVWYDILHVAEVLSRFPFVHDDARFRQMLQTILAQADADGRFTATSMYRAWNGFSFADKKRPSPWLSFLVYRILKRVARGEKGAGI
jgi:hypothetical protein